jgi:outer membrane receptor for ferrienterochelin and colicins
LQDDWRIGSHWIVESGIRLDVHNEFGAFVLPRVSILWKINPLITSRLGGGFGYKVPTLFNSEIDERDYRFIKFAANGQLKAERSVGANWDINYKKRWKEFVLSINQSFYVTRIDHPLVADTTGGSTVFRTANLPIVTKGFETWLQLSYKGLEGYLGYTFVDAKRNYDPIHPFIELSARNKFASVISYEFSEKFRACVEASYTGRQYLADGSRTASFPIAAAMIRYDIRHFSFVLNCENIFDYRQTNKEGIVIPPLNDPRFKQIWAPIDGRAINLSVKVKF